MKIITIEEHYMNTAVTIASGELMNKLCPSYREAYNQGDAYSPTPSKLMEIGAERLANMDANGIDVQIISTSGTEILPAKEAVPLSRTANDQLAAAINEHPGRFAGFASLPTPDPAAAAVELERAVNKLGFKGATIYGRTNGRFMDDPMFNPILEAASALDVPLYLHPSIPSRAIQNEYYGGLDPLVSARFATGGWGWHNEAGIQALRMILAGVFDKYPNLQIILGHWGEMVPFYLSRTDSVLTPVAKNLKRSVSDYFLNNVYVTPSGMFDYSQLMHTHQVMGADRIMYSVDYPFTDNKGARAFLENAAISPADKEKIAHGNAERLLKL